MQMRRTNKLRIIALLGAVAMLLLAPVVLAATQVFSDAEVRKQLDRLLFPEQYLLDITYNQDGSGASTTTRAPGAAPTQAWPGLAFLGTSSTLSSSPSDAAEVVARGGIVDVLLVIDSGVSNERANLAKEIVGRLADAAKIQQGMRLVLRREPMLRKPPPELYPTQRIENTGNQPQNSQGNQSSPSAGPGTAPGEKAQPSTQTLYDFLENKRDLALRSLLVIWTAIASLVALVLMISRRNRLNLDIGGNGGIGMPVANGGGGSGGAVDEASVAATSKARIAEQDALAHRATIQKYAAEIVDQAGKQPKKVAAVISDWITKSSEGSRHAAILLRNCDVVTIENICQFLHPSDIDKMMEQKTDEVEPFSAENRLVLEHMRTALARLAANKKFIDRPDPLAILKTVSDDALAKALENEDLNSVAVVSAQIPAHRLQKYFAKLSESDHQKLMAAIVDLEAVKLDDMTQIANRLQDHLQSINEVLIDENTIRDAAKRVILATKHPKRQIALAAGLKILKPQVFQAIRADIDLAIDLMYYNPRPMRVFFQSVDGEKLGIAFSNLGVDTAEWIATMPEALAVVFQENISRTHEERECEKAWKAVRATLADLTNSGLISRTETIAAKTKADEVALGVFNGGQPNPTRDEAQDSFEAKHGAA